MAAIQPSWAAPSERALDEDFRSDQLVHVFRAGRASLGDDVAPQAPHAAEPALIICRFVLAVFLGDRMGQNKNPLRQNALDHRVGDLPWRDGALRQFRLMIFRVAQHRRCDILRADDGDLDAVVAMGDRQRLGEAQCRMFGG